MSKKLMIFLLLYKISALQAIPGTIINAIQNGSSTQESTTDTSQPQLYNRSTFPVNAYMYSGVMTTNGSQHSIDENSLLNPIAIIIPPGGSVNWLKNTRSVSVFYEAKDPIMTNIQSANSYIITPSADKWTITQKIRNP